MKLNEAFSAVELIEDTTALTKEDWLKERTRGIGGSDAAAAIGISQWKSPIELFYEKTENVKETQMNDALWFGTKMEPIVAERFAEEHPDYKVEEVNKILCHPEHKFMIANLDRLVTLPDGTKQILEIKTANEFQKDKWEDGDVPSNYVTQVQHYLAVTGAQFAWIACLLGQGHYYERLIERDDDFISMMIEEEKKFWNCVETNTPPQWDGSKSAAELLKKLYPTVDKATKIILPSEYEENARKYIELDKRLKEINETAASIKKARDAQAQYLQAAMGTAEIAELGSYQLKRGITNVKEKIVAAYSYQRFSVKTLA